MPQHPVGCRCCGIKSNARFRPWETCCDSAGFEGVLFARPMSDVVCTNCYQRARRNTLKVRACGAGLNCRCVTFLLAEVFVFFILLASTTLVPWCSSDWSPCYDVCWRSCMLCCLDLLFRPPGRVLCHRDGEMMTLHTETRRGGWQRTGGG
jgi:hypothetical protein